MNQAFQEFFVAGMTTRFKHLDALAKDPLVINSDGTPVDPYREMAAELYEKPVAQVTFEERNSVMPLIQKALFRETIRSNMGNQPQWGQNYTAGSGEQYGGWGSHEEESLYSRFFK